MIVTKRWIAPLLLLILAGCTTVAHSDTDDALRVVSLAPSFTTILLDLDAVDLIVAADEHSQELILSDGVATVDMMHPEIEQLVSLNPDVIFVSELTLVDLSHLETFDIRVYQLPTPQQISDISVELLFIGEIVDRDTQAQALVTQFEQALTELQARVPDRDAPLTVYFEIMPAPHLFSFGQDVFLDELLKKAGLQNIFHDATGWFPVDAERVVDANPDIILTNVDFIPDAISDIMNRDGWQSVRAIENHRVYFVANNYTSRPTHHLTWALEMIIEAIYE